MERGRSRGCLVGAAIDAIGLVLREPIAGGGHLVGQAEGGGGLVPGLLGAGVFLLDGVVGVDFARFKFVDPGVQPQ